MTQTNAIMIKLYIQVEFKYAQPSTNTMGTL